MQFLRMGNATSQWPPGAPPYHDSPTGGHMGFKRTYKRCRDSFWWRLLRRKRRRGAGTWLAFSPRGRVENALSAVSETRKILRRTKRLRNVGLTPPPQRRSHTRSNPPSARSPALRTSYLATVPSSYRHLRTGTCCWRTCRCIFLVRKTKIYKWKNLAR